MGTLAMVCWLGTVHSLCLAELQWGSPAVNPSAKTVANNALRPAVHVVRASVEQVSPKMRRDYQVMAATWEQEDARDALALPKAHGDFGIPANDPFDEDARWAQLPSPEDDPFDEPVEDEQFEDDLIAPNEEWDESMEEESEEESQDIESEDTAEEIEKEFERRRKEDLEISEEELRKRLLESDPLLNKNRDEFDPNASPEDWLNEARDKTDDRLEKNQGQEDPFGMDAEEREYPAPQLDRGKQDEQLEKERIENERNCQEEFAKLRDDSIRDIDLNINLEGREGEDYPFECKIGQRTLEPRQWPLLTFNWKASALCHKPLYFEQVQLERYGHSWGPFSQPIMSGVHFFSSVPILPYKMGVRTPCECVYTLGHYRPGNCAPFMIEPMPLSLRGALFQAGAVTGVSLVVP